MIGFYRNNLSVINIRLILKDHHLEEELVFAKLTLDFQATVKWKVAALSVRLIKPESSSVYNLNYLIK